MVDGNINWQCWRIVYTWWSCNDIVLIRLSMLNNLICESGINNIAVYFFRNTVKLQVILFSTNFSKVFIRGPIFLKTFQSIDLIPPYDFFETFSRMKICRKKYAISHSTRKFRKRESLDRLRISRHKRPFMRRISELCLTSACSSWYINFWPEIPLIFAQFPIEHKELLSSILRRIDR